MFKRFVLLRVQVKKLTLALLLHKEVTVQGNSATRAHCAHKLEKDTTNKLKSLNSTNSVLMFLPYTLFPVTK